MNGRVKEVFKNELIIKNCIMVDMLSSSGRGFISILFSGNMPLNAFEIQ